MTPGAVGDPTVRRPAQARDVALVDLIDRLLDGGVVIHGDITLAVADVDLLYVGLRALVASVNTIEEKMGVRLSAHSAVLDNDRLDVDAFGSDSLDSGSFRSDALDSDALDSDALDSDPFHSDGPGG
jgi:hypothetical protein